ncbi:hypothetical protein BIY37_02065 [Candidatus Brocadia sapporoensis]|uniref:Uncharacterized protein n=1 Tax=Candidatus Brocadia sapporoensis TaxID=392547 RepID=A0A1V6M2R7_9BACT|nr:hypothetical protein BIY37_02065 [Candidatus Brocadia sapporoensis]
MFLSLFLLFQEKRYSNRPCFKEKPPFQKTKLLPKFKNIIKKMFDSMILLTIINSLENCG